jgi:hypothetical protein
MLLIVALGHTVPSKDSPKEDLDYLMSAT